MKEKLWRCAGGLGGERRGEPLAVAGSYGTSQDYLSSCPVSPSHHRYYCQCSASSSSNGNQERGGHLFISWCFPGP